MSSFGSSGSRIGRRPARGRPRRSACRSRAAASRPARRRRGRSGAASRRAGSRRARAAPSRPTPRLRRRAARRSSCRTRGRQFLPSALATRMSSPGAARSTYGERLEKRGDRVRAVGRADGEHVRAARPDSRAGSRGRRRSPRPRRRASRRHGLAARPARSTRHGRRPAEAQVDDALARPRGGEDAACDLARLEPRAVALARRPTSAGRPAGRPRRAPTPFTGAPMTRGDAVPCSPPSGAGSCAFSASVFARPANSGWVKSRPESTIVTGLPGPGGGLALEADLREPPLVGLRADRALGSSRRRGTAARACANASAPRARETREQGRCARRASRRQSRSCGVDRTRAGRERARRGRADAAGVSWTSVDAPADAVEAPPARARGR